MLDRDILGYASGKSVLLILAEAKSSEDIHRLILTLQPEFTLVLSQTDEDTAANALSLDQYAEKDVALLDLSKLAQSYQILDLFFSCFGELLTVASEVLGASSMFRPLKPNLMTFLRESIMTPKDDLVGSTETETFLYAAGDRRLAAELSGKTFTQFAKTTARTLAMLGPDLLSIGMPAGSVAAIMQAPKSRPGMDVYGWGYRIWPLFHHLSFKARTDNMGAVIYEWVASLLQAIIPCGACERSYVGFRQQVKPTRLVKEDNEDGGSGIVGWPAWESRATPNELRQSAYDLHNCVNDKLDGQHFEQALEAIAAGHAKSGNDEAANRVRAAASDIIPHLTGRRVPLKKVAKRFELDPMLNIRSIWLAMLILTLNYWPDRPQHRLGFRAAIPILVSVFSFLCGCETGEPIPPIARRSIDILSRLALCPVGYSWALQSTDNMFSWWCTVYAQVLNCSNPSEFVKCMRSKFELARAGQCSKFACV